MAFHIHDYGLPLVFVVDGSEGSETVREIDVTISRLSNVHMTGALSVNVALIL